MYPRLLAVVTFLLAACDGSAGGIDTGNGMVVITPMTVEFGMAQIGETKRSSVTVQSVGAGTLNLSQIVVDPEGVFGFTFPVTRVLPPGTNITIALTATPERLGTNFGTLIMVTDDAAQKRIDINLRVRGIGCDGGMCSPD